MPVFCVPGHLVSKWKWLVSLDVLLKSTFWSAVAINSWLKEAPAKHVTLPINMHYIAKNSTLEITETVHSFLGEKDEAKTWLTACLLKTIKDNERWHKRTELIDDFPEATSWFRETL